MNETFIKQWEKVLDILKEEISPVAFKTYIEVVIPRLVDENTVCLLAPSEYHIEVLSKKYLDLISNSLSFVSCKNYIICFESKENFSPKEEVKQSTNENPQQNRVEESVPIQPTQNVQNTFSPTKNSSCLNSKYTFENYIVGSNNRFAHDAAFAVSEEPGTKFNPFYIYGGVGLGKTHLMQAIGHAIIKNNPKLNIIYTTGESFANELVESIIKSTNYHNGTSKSTSENEAFRNKYRNIDVLLIDDIQFLAGKEKCQEEFFHTFNTLFQSGKQIILASEKPPKENKMFQDNLKTRFEMGLTVDVQAPDYETRLAILKKKRDNERYLISDDVLIKIATRVTSNIRELEGVFNKLVAYTSFTNKELTDEIIDNTIESILVKSTNVITSKHIMQIVCKFFNIRNDEMLSQNRSKNVAYPRQIAMYLCRSTINMTLPQIGKDFGGKDHTTVLHAYNKISEEYASDENTKKLIDDITKSLKTRGST